MHIATIEKRGHEFEQEKGGVQGCGDKKEKENVIINIQSQ